VVYFFFQAEDGIRDATVTGVQTCALPIFLMIVVDTLRADRLDFYETQRDLTQFLASLAAHGQVFWNAYAQSPWTMPSVASLWTRSEERRVGKECWCQAEQW